jgi:hypothetical protein
MINSLCCDARLFGLVLGHGSRAYRLTASSDAQSSARVTTQVAARAIKAPSGIARMNGPKLAPRLSSYFLPQPRPDGCTPCAALWRGDNDCSCANASYCVERRRAGATETTAASNGGAACLRGIHGVLDPLACRCVAQTLVNAELNSWYQLADRGGRATHVLRAGVRHLRVAYWRLIARQFVGGPTAKATLPLLRQLRHDNVGCLFAYSVEDDEDASGSGHYKARVKETLRCIDVAADFEDEMNSGQRKTWVAIKLVCMTSTARSGC